ncbi:MAG: sugar ABC transporter ATP-binding protein [Propionicimonas sp.]|uniref:sugar ABC transporter ATP-binding protein n=1 Tax=Propionicimonas sp. TaxID=1955623 RepID=UPI002B211332|nr:sugar ABC transporter ATP-binding protein [Propionicimonas sp.]MEA4944850.1 sugar ABC transporter ATP-binding protein [Propionicimonas sp.]
MTDPEVSPVAELVATGITKTFPGVRALDNVDVSFPRGRVTALMGENGAGKSTLLKILNGDYQPDSGTITLGGHHVSFTSPSEARRAGLRVISQEPEIAPHVTVAENMYLGRMPARFGMVSQKAMKADAAHDLERLGFAGLLDPGQIAITLSPAQRQLLEIVRALIDDPAVICFDEPTSSLSDHEIAALFACIRRLRDDGRAIAYVSHRMREVFQIADSVTVLRDGRLVGSREVAEVGEQDIIQLMVGRDLSSMHQRTPHQPGEVRLQLTGVTTADVRDINLAVRAREIVAIAGLVGAGRSELALAIAGDRPILSGAVEVDGRPLVSRTPGDAIARGVGLAPEDRKGDALVMIRTVRDNIALATLRKLSRFGFVSDRKERKLARTYIDRLNVRTPSMEQRVENLSGGNQQKVVLARWLAGDSQVLILDEPTRGVDVGAKAEIYRIIDGLAQAGAAILVISSELPEVLGLADRIVVMQNGHITGELTRAEATEEKVLALAMADELETAGA